MKIGNKAICLLIAVIMAFSCLASCSAEATVMEYKGKKLPENLYSYWMASFKRTVLNTFPEAKTDSDFWEQEYTDGVTNGEYFTGLMQDQIKKYLISEKLFSDYRLKLDAEVVQNIEDDINEKIEFYGSRAALNEELAAAGMNIDTYREVCLWEERHQAVVNYLFLEGGPQALTAEQLSKYYEDNYSLINYIVVYTTKLVLDEYGQVIYEDDHILTEPMTEDELAAAKAKADEAEQKAKDGEEFTELMTKYSDYSTLEDYPNGLFVSLNEADSYGYPLALAMINANENEIFRFEEENAIFIIKKYPLKEFSSLENSDIQQLKSLEGYCIDEFCSAYFDELAKEVTVNEEICSAYTIDKISASPSSKF